MGYAGNELSVDLLSGPIHGGGMSAIPELTEPLTGQITGALDMSEVSGMHHRASSSNAMHRAPSADDMSPMGPPADTTVAALQPGTTPASTRPPTMQQGGLPDQKPLMMQSPVQGPPGGPRSGAAPGDRADGARR